MVYHYSYIGSDDSTRCSHFGLSGGGYFRTRGVIQYLWPVPLNLTWGADLQ